MLFFLVSCFPRSLVLSFIFCFQKQIYLVSLIFTYGLPTLGNIYSKWYSNIKRWRISKICWLITGGLKCWSHCCTPWSLSTFYWFWHSVSIFHRRSRPGLPWIRNAVHISQNLTLNLRIWVCCMTYHIIGFSDWYNWESSWISLNIFGVSTDL